MYDILSLSTSEIEIEIAHLVSLLELLAQVKDWNKPHVIGAFFCFISKRAIVDILRI